MAFISMFGLSQIAFKDFLQIGLEFDQGVLIGPNGASCNRVLTTENTVMVVCGMSKQAGYHGCIFLSSTSNVKVKMFHCFSLLSICMNILPQIMFHLPWVLML